MTEYWKRREKLVAMKAGMVDFEKEEHERPEFIVSAQWTL
jgi:hypothetical protein